MVIFHRHPDSICDLFSFSAITLSIFPAFQAYHLSTMGIHVDLKICEDSKGPRAEKRPKSKSHDFMENPTVRSWIQLKDAQKIFQKDIPWNFGFWKSTTTSTSTSTSSSNSNSSSTSTTSTSTNNSNSNSQQPAAPPCHQQHKQQGEEEEEETIKNKQVKSTSSTHVSNHLEHPKLCLLVTPLLFLPIVFLICSFHPSHHNHSSPHTNHISPSHICRCNCPG